MFAADLHIHSKYSYACSKDISLDALAAWANLKGIDLISSADFTHPGWIKEIKKYLVQCDEGIYEYKNVKFVLGTEVSCIYRE